MKDSMLMEADPQRFRSTWAGRSYQEAVLRDVLSPGALNLSGYNDVQRVLQDSKRFTRPIPVHRRGKPLQVFDNWAVFRCGEVHSALRDLLLACLGEVAEAIQPSFDVEVQAVVARHVGATGIDARVLLANALTYRFIELACGISLGSVTQLDGASKLIDMSGDRAYSSPDIVTDALMLFLRTARESPLLEIAKRKAKLEAIAIDEEIITQNVGMLIYAFFGPLPALLTNIVLAASQHGDQNAVAVSNPRGWLRECLRLYSPTSAIDRMAMEDVRIAGMDVRRGQVVRCIVANANRDGAIFEAPHWFKVGRKPAIGHFSFGRGLHSCIGVGLTERPALALIRSLMSQARGIELLSPTIEWCTRINATVPVSLMVRLLSPPEG